MAAGRYRDTLGHPGVQSFLWTQFLGAFNDNVFKIIVSLLALDRLGLERGAWIVGAVFILPFLLFSGYAGHLADRYGKRTVLVATKSLEIVSMLLALVGLVTGRLDVLLAVLFLMATQSTFFSPAKYGIVPEILPNEDLSRANGLLEMSTFAAIVLGTAFGGELIERGRDLPWLQGGVLVAIAVIGFVASFGIRRVPAAKPDRRLSLNPWAEIGHGFRRLLPDRTLRMTVVGLSFFWFLGALLQMALLPFGEQVLGVGEAAATRLYTPLAVGIATGSLVAGRLSGEKIELGLVPIGAFGLGIFSVVFAGVSGYLSAATTLGVLGFAGGFFAVPLQALVQQRPADDEKGRVLATNNVANTVGILLASAVLAVLNDWWGLTIAETLTVVGVATLVASVYVLATVPDFFVRFVLWLLVHSLYRIRIIGRPHIPQRGPALVIANHVSWIDGPLIAACVQRFIRFMVYAPYYRHRLAHPLLRRMHAIPVMAGRPADVAQAIERARQELVDGHVVCIFVEGSVSRTGNLLPFRRGFERIVAGLDVPIVPVYLDRVWGSVFSFSRGKFLWKRPKRLPYPVTVTFGAALPSSATASQARMAVMDLSTSAMRERRPPSDLLHTVFARSARRHWSRPALADSLGTELTYGRTLTAVLALSRVIAKRTPGERTVGLLLPASAGGVLANIATLAAGRTVANLNFTIGPEALDAAIRQADIRTILTSKRFLAKLSMEHRPGMLYLEDLRNEIGPVAKLTALLHARLLPMPTLRRRYGGRNRDIDSLATIIFSSGSTGVPKGVMLSHRNLLANTDSLAQVFPLGPEDCFIGVLPFFHSFGLTGTMWFPLTIGARIAYHPNPTDAKVIGDLALKYGATMLISTPTFCQAYVRRCTKEQLASLKYAIVGAEKLREPIARAFREKFGVELLEGYGCTEMSPVVSVNRPDEPDGRTAQIGRKPGSVGHPIPGVAAKVVDPATGEGPLVDREGLLLVKGANMMTGYLDQPDLTAGAIRDGWYVTGDIARIDHDGFIFITDRLARFSKIGGEMVPHVRIEDVVNDIFGEACAAVTAVPDETRGERLVVFYVKPDVTPQELSDRLAGTDLPRLWVPRRENLVPIDAIPTLGTGKVDLRKLREMAMSLATVAAD